MGGCQSPPALAPLPPVDEAASEAMLAAWTLSRTSGFERGSPSFKEAMGLAHAAAELAPAWTAPERFLDRWYHRLGLSLPDRYADHLAGRPSSAQQTGHLVRAATAARPGLGGGDGRAWRGRSGTGLAEPSLRDPEPRVLRVSNVPQRRDRGGGGGGGDDEDEEDGGGGDEDLRALCSRYGWIEALEPRVWSPDPVGTVWVLTMGERAAADALLAAAGRGELVLQGQRLEVQREEAPECVVFGGDVLGDF